MKTKFTYSIITALVLSGVAIIAGCSSSGGSTDSTVDGGTTAVATQVGTFVDARVQGLSYKGVKSGTTNIDGNYDFQGSERVTFGLGQSLVLGSLVPKTTPVSPLDFFDGTVDADDTRVSNILRLLQSLDADGNTSNGITITSDGIAALEAALVPTYFPSLTDVNISVLDDQNITDILTVVVDGNYSNLDEVVDANDSVAHLEDSLPKPPPSPVISGTLKCDNDGVSPAEVPFAADFNASQTLKRNVSSKSVEDANRQNPTSHNTIERLDVIVPERTSDGNLTGSGVSVHPIFVNYTQQVVGGYEMGDGSADIGDPTHVDGVFTAVSLDKGTTWKNYTISDTSDKSSMEVVWDLDKTATKIEYPGHAQKPTMAVEGNNILVAWNDKYCPSGNPFNLTAVTTDTNTSYPEDFFAINGKQNSIDYAEAQDGSRVVMIAPNGKEVYEVPFSCVWTARGIFDPVTGEVTWHAPMQLTTGTRDSNHIWIEGSAAGFAMTWQEDTEGLRAGKGEGPGDGWSGATTNHGSDIWYTSIKMTQFAETNSTDELDTTKPKSKYNFHYPMRITDNQSCSNDDTKAYCKSLCNTYGYETFTTNNNKADDITRCNTYDIDMLTDTTAILNGDTGASRSALKLLETTEGQTVVVFGYEETKGLSESDPGVPDQEKGDSETIIALEGKSVYFESFLFDAIDDFNATDPDIIQKMAMPLVSAGNIINVKVPDQNTSEMIYENARRLVIGEQIDACDADRFNFAFMYKQSFDTQGASSDMFIRVNNGFTYGSFIALDERNVTNVSAQKAVVVENIVDYNVSWTEANLDDNTYENPNDNTFSPRIFLRGNAIYTGFEYTPNDVKTSQENMPSNFHTHIYTGTTWLPPQNVTMVTKGGSTTVDARFFGTGEGINSGLPSDQSNPNVLFVTWGEIDWINNEDHDLGKAESNLYYKRALYVDGVWNWDANASMLAARDGAVLQEKEVESYASPDGKTIYNVWLQESEEYNQSDPFSGLDSWFGRVDFNISNIVAP
ncbi:MAG: choice-of-anchor O protein [Sulfurimonas sp.]|nr:choice-of-anchor O protein [Sulfurimonas sp.]